MRGWKLGCLLLCGSLLALHGPEIIRAQNRAMSGPPQASSKGVIASTRGGITLRARRVRSTLFRVESGATGASVKSILERLRPDLQVYLILREPRVAAPPGILYHVYFDLPKDAEPAPGDPHFVGNLNFFNEEPPREGSTTSALGSSRSRSFEITSIVRKLGAKNLLSEESTVTIIPSRSKEPEGDATLAGIELVLE